MLIIRNRIIKCYLKTEKSAFWLNSVSINRGWDNLLILMFRWGAERIFLFTQRKVPGSDLSWFFLCGVGMFSPCMCRDSGFPPQSKNMHVRADWRSCDGLVVPRLARWVSWTQSLVFIVSSFAVVPAGFLHVSVLLLLLQWDQNNSKLPCRNQMMMRSDTREDWSVEGS